MNKAPLRANIARLINTDLAPIVNKIDQEGFYPHDFLLKLAELGGFAALGDKTEGGLGLGLLPQIQIIAQISKSCATTGFVTWCQSVCAFYLQRSNNQALKQRYLADILNGKILAGTAMSNTLKHLSGIEKNKLYAQKTTGGYLVNGTLPWVSNIGKKHIWAATATLDNQYLMFITKGNSPGLTLTRTAPFCALEGTRTFAIKYDNVFVEEADLIATSEAFEEYIQSIQNGFVLLQIGLGAGIIQACLTNIAKSNKTNAENNQYLPHSYLALEAEFKAILAQTKRLATQAEKADILAIYRLRLAAAELVLQAAQSAALHVGATGYLLKHSAQRHSREALFVAIVTPSIKHLRKVIAQSGA